MYLLLGVVGGGCGGETFECSKRWRVGGWIDGRIWFSGEELVWGVVFMNGGINGCSCEHAVTYGTREGFIDWSVDEVGDEVFDFTVEEDNEHWRTSSV